MDNSIHGHEVMNFMLEQSGGFSRQSLLLTVEERFGVEARFHTCSAKDLTAAQLIDLLEAKGKFVATEGGLFTTQADRICSH